MGVRGGEHGHALTGDMAADEGVDVLIEVNQRAWDRLKDSLVDVSDDEATWRPHPLGNNIDVIVRHLRIEGEWHRDSLVHGTAMPFEITPALQARINAVPLDYTANFSILEKVVIEFIEALGTTTLEALVARTSAAYGSLGDQASRRHFLGYHQAMHLSMHCGQIRTIRNLYRKSRGEPAPFFPDNPTFPAVK